VTKILQFKDIFNFFEKTTEPNPKYLKLIVNSKPKYEAMSSGDILAHTFERKIMLNKEKEAELFKNKKLNLFYTNKKNANLIFSLLNRIQTRNGSITKSFLRKSGINDFTEILKHLKEQLGYNNHIENKKRSSPER
jgi:hypothetical protein